MEYCICEEWVCAFADLAFAHSTIGLSSILGAVDMYGNVHIYSISQDGKDVSLTLQIKITVSITASAQPTAEGTPAWCSGGFGTGEEGLLAV